MAQIIVRNLSENAVERLKARAKQSHRSLQAEVCEILEAEAVRTPTAEQNCMQFLGEQYGLWNDAHRTPDEFFKLRLSLIELLFREAESILRGLSPRGDVKGWWSLLQKRQQPPSKSAVERALEAVMLGIEELNERFRNANVHVEYHNGIIQRVEDRLTSQQIEAPFVATVALVIWCVGKRRKLSDWLNYRWLQYLGGLSYSIFLLHVVIGGRVYTCAGVRSNSWTCRAVQLKLPDER